MSDHAWVLENLDAYLANDLSADERGNVERHTAACDACQQTLAESRRAEKLVQGLFADARPDAELEDRMIARLRKEPPRRSGQPALLRFAMAAAAVLVVALIGAVVQAIAMDGKGPFSAQERRDKLSFFTKGKAVPDASERELVREGLENPTHDAIPPSNPDPAVRTFDEDIKYSSDRVADVSVPGSEQALKFTLRDKKEMFEAEGELRKQTEALGKLLDTAKDKDLPPLILSPPGNASVPSLGFGGFGQGGAIPMGPGTTTAKVVGEVGGYGPRGMELPGSFYGRSGKDKEKAREAGYDADGLFYKGKGKLDLKPGDNKAGDKGDGKEGKELGEYTFNIPGTPPPVVNPAKGYFTPEDIAKLAPPGRTPTAKKSPPVAETPKPSESGKGENPKATEVAQGGDKKPDKKPAPDPEPEINPGRKIIRTGEVEFETESFDSAFDTVNKLITAVKGGFIATANSDKLPNGKMRGSVVVRMPPQHLDKFLLDLRRELTKGGELKSQRIGSQDVTKQYTDTESELRAARAVEGRLIDIIKTGKGEIKDLIAAERELGVWRTKIEKMEGEIRYYNNQVSLSTLTITLYEKEIQAPSALVVTERVGMRLEVEEVEKAYQIALKAVADAKGRVTKAELKQHNVGQLEAVLHAEVSPSAKDAFSDALKKLGIVSHHDAMRLQQAEGGTGRGQDLKPRQSDVRFEITIHDLINVQPRHTVNMQVAASDVPENYYKLRDAIIKVKGQIRTGQINEQDKLNITAQLDFNVPSAEKPAIDKLLAELGLVLSRNNIQAPVTELSTDRKQGYVLSLRDFANIAPRYAVNLQIATTDVPAYYLKLQEALRLAKAQIRVAQLNEQDKLNVTAQIDFSVMAAEKPTIDKLLEEFGLVLSRKNAQAPMNDLSTDRKFGYSLVLRNLSDIPPSQVADFKIAANDVPTLYTKLLDAIAKAKGQVHASKLNEQDNLNISAQLAFTVPTGEKGAMDKLLTEAGTVLSRNNAQAPVTELLTDRKYGYTVALRDFANIPPSQVVELKIAATDVPANLAKLLDAIAKVKGQVRESKLNEQDKLSITAQLAFTVPTAEKLAIDKLLIEIGTTLSRNNVQAPVTELSTDRKFGYAVVLRDFASILPRETFNLQIATQDVQASFRELQDAVHQVQGLVQVGQVIEDNKVHIAAKLDFIISAADRAEIEKKFAKVGAVLSRTSSQVAVNEIATDQKIGYKLILRSTANIPPRETATLKIEVKDVDGKVADLKDQVVAAKGRVVDSNITRLENGRVTAKVIYEVPLASLDTMVRQIKAHGTLVSQDSKRNPQIPDNELATAHIVVNLTGASPIVPNDESFGSYINSSLYFSFRIFAYCLMIIIVGISAILPWTLVLWVVYKVYGRMSGPTVELVAVAPASGDTLAGSEGTAAKP